MNKTEAAEFLGVSPRAVERYASSNRLASYYVRGKTGKVLAFDVDELERFKAELDTPQVRDTPEPDDARQKAIQAVIDPTSTQPTSSALSRRGGSSSGLNAEVMSTLQALAQLASDNARQAAPTVPTEAKLLLTLDEARALTGLSRSTLRAAIEASQLKGKLVGRGFKVKRTDLDLYIDKL